MSMGQLLPLAVSAGAEVLPAAGRLVGRTLARPLFAAVLGRWPNPGGGTAEPEDGPVEPDTALARQLAFQTQSQAAEDQLEELRTRLRQRLAEHGVDTSQPIELYTDGRGEVLERSGHSQRARIEALLSEPGLTSAFERVARLVLGLRPDDTALDEFVMQLGSRP